MRFIAIASVVCASVEIEPSDIAPVAKRLTISLAGSTSSSGIALLRVEPELEQAAQRHVAAALVVDELRVFLVGLVVVGARRVLQLGDRVRRPHVLFAAHAPLVLAAGIEHAVPAPDRPRTPPGACAPLLPSLRTGPTPPMLLAVPRKYLSTRSLRKPTASKICAPQYDMYVLMPILDMTLFRPLPIALM